MQRPSSGVTRDVIGRLAHILGTVIKIADFLQDSGVQELCKTGWNMEHKSQHDMTFVWVENALETVIKMMFFL